MATPRQCQGKTSRKKRPPPIGQARDHRQRRRGRARRQAVGPARHLCRDPAGRSHGDPERPDLGRRLHRPDRRRIQRAAGRGREGLPDAPQESGHRRDERGRSARRLPPPSSRGSSEVGWRLVEDPVTGARLGLPGKLATKATRAAERHALGVRSGPVAGRDLPHRHRRDARSGVRAAEKNAAPAHREQRAAGRQLRHLRDAGPEEDGGARLRARTARCAASPSSTTRRWKAPWTRWWRRCRARSCRSPRASPWRAPPTRRAARSSTAPACSSPPPATC